MRFYFIRFKCRLYFNSANFIRFSGHKRARMSIVDWKAEFVALFVAQMKNVRIVFTANGKREVRFVFS